MRNSIITRAAWLALSTLAITAPLPSANIHLDASTSSSLQRSQIDTTKERRDAQLVVPDVFPSHPSQSSSSNTRPEHLQIPEELGLWSEDASTPSDVHLPKNAHVLFPTSNTINISHTRRQSLDHTTSQIDFNGEPIPDHGGDTPSTETTSNDGGHTKRGEAPPRPSTGIVLELEDRWDSQKKASGDIIDASNPPKATVDEERKKKGEIHGGCDEFNLAQPFRRRDGNVPTGVHWAC